MRRDAISLTDITASGGGNVGQQPLSPVNSFSAMNPVESWIFGVTLQALLYGLYVGTLAHCLRWLLFDDEGWSHRKNVNWAMLTVTIFIFLLSTGSLAMMFQSFFVLGTVQLDTAAVSAPSLPEE